MTTLGPDTIRRPIHHFGYCVEDLDRAIEAMVATFGAGPFFVVANVPVVGATSQGAPATFDHSSAFGRCGDTYLELMQIHRVEPAAVDDGFGLPRPGLHHVAWVVPSLDDEVAALERAGLPSYLRAGLGQIAFSYHDARGVLGHDIELHQECDDLRTFFARFEEASKGWDGSDPVRSAF